MKRLCLFFVLLLLCSCSHNKSKIYDLTPLYERFLERTSVDTTTDIAEIQADINDIYRTNYYTLSTLTMVQSNKEIINLSKKIRSTPNKKLAAMYTRELNFYKPLYFENNYYHLRLNDIPLQYRKDEDKLASNNPNIVETDAIGRIISDSSLIVSGRCIKSIYKIAVMSNDRELASIDYGTDDENRSFRFDIDTASLNMYENVLVIRAYRYSKEFYDYKYNVYRLPQESTTVSPNTADFTVKQTDKTDNYGHVLYEIDMSKCKNNLNYYSLIDASDCRVGFECKIIGEQFQLFFKRNDSPLYLFIVNEKSKKQFALKHYTNGDMILEYYPGQENYTDYYVFTKDSVYRASDLARQNSLSSQFIFTKVNELFLLAEYSENTDKPVKLYYFDENMQLETIKKKQINKYLYKTFTKDDIFYNL